MTREEKIAILKDIIDGEIIHPQVRRDVGTWAIEELEQEPILDKVRAEIEAYTDLQGFITISEGRFGNIFDKYKAETEDT